MVLSRMLLASLLLTTSLAWAVDYRVIDLGAGVTPAALSEGGRIGGSGPGGFGVGRPMLLHPDLALVPLNPLAPEGVINALTAEAGTGRLGGHAFLFTPSLGLVDLDADDPPAFSQGNALNDTITVGGLHNHGFITSPILWLGNTSKLFLEPLDGTPLGNGVVHALDASGDAFGESDLPSGVPHAVWWPVTGGVVDLDPDHPERVSRALAVSPAFVYLDVETPAGLHVARLSRSTGVLEDLGTLPGDDIALPSGVNRHDVGVGLSLPGGPGGISALHAIRINADGSLEDLNALVDAPEWVLEVGIKINDVGQIIGTGRLHGERHGFLLQPVHDGTPPAAEVPGRGHRVRVARPGVAHPAGR